MIDQSILDSLINKIKKGEYLSIDDYGMISSTAVEIINSCDLTEEEITVGNKIVELSSILYENSTSLILPLEDGVYDLLVAKIKSPIIGAAPSSNGLINDPTPLAVGEELIDVVSFVDMPEDQEFMYWDNIVTHYPYNWVDPIWFNRPPTTKRLLDTAHGYPELVGTLDKCKFVLNADAKERGVFDDDSVTIFERDFIQKHIASGILDPHRKFTMIAELKYDGVSVEADCLDVVLGARSRGDTSNDLATDLTPILGGYIFPDAPINLAEPIGVKFEAILTKSSLIELSKRKNKAYKNCRNAVQAITGSLDGYLYRDLLTLVPLAVSIPGEHLNRVEEIEFLNTYYSSGEKLRYAVLYGDYVEILFQVRQFVKEAEFLREVLPFMFDGVVISYMDEDIRQALGRVNSVNKYSIAIKFNPLKKLSIFSHYTYTIGQNGNVTPMINYTPPVEFYGTIHSVSSGHSYNRFKELSLRTGDMLDIEYTNDVMPYATKSENEYNMDNTNPIVPFISHCPACGTELVLSTSGKSILCPNIKCPARAISRMVNMLQKLNLKDFSEASLRAINKSSLKELLELKKEDLVGILGDVNSSKFIDRMNSLKENPIEDYKIIGALGFSGIGKEKWRIILNKYYPDDILFLDEPLLYDALISIKGIGKHTVRTICDERDLFMEDLTMILQMPNIIRTKGAKLGKSIRFSGIRDPELEEYLISMGYDASSEKGVTAATDILLVPNPGFTSSKTKKAGENTIIVSIQEFKDDLNKYL